MVAFQKYCLFSAGETRETGCDPTTHQIAWDVLTFTEFTCGIAWEGLKFQKNELANFMRSVDIVWKQVPILLGLFDSDRANT